MSSGNEHLRYAWAFLVLAVIALTTAVPQFAHAVPANPEPITGTQPDGTPYKIFIRGDEYRNWQEDEQGYTVVEQNGWYRYAELDTNGALRASQYTVGKVVPATVGLSPKLRAKNNTIPSAVLSTANAASGPRITPIGTVKQVVILMRFSNHTGRPVPSVSDISTLFNAVGGDPVLAPTGSMRDVYYENSYGQVTINSTVFAWVNLPKTESYYAANVSGVGTGGLIDEAIVAALNAADAQINFSQFDDDHDGFVDAIAFLHSGYAAEHGGTDAYGTAYQQRIWSHRGSIPTWTSAEGVKVNPYHLESSLWDTTGSAISHVGVLCHEAGHFFGLPDLYDIDNSGGEGIGSWCMMANPWGFDGTDYHPPHFSSWCKIRLGWVEPSVIAVPGNYSLPQWETNPTVYRIDQGYPPGEYLLIENREPVGIESDMPQGGLIVFHIDDPALLYVEGYPGQPGWPQNGAHYRVSVLQADGQYDLERGNNRGGAGDPYRASAVHALTPATLPSTNTYQGGRIRYSGNTISNISAPGSAMTFTLGFGDPLRLGANPNVWWTFDSIGPVGGPFVPPATDGLSVSNVGASDLTVNVVSQEPWLEASSSPFALSNGSSLKIAFVVSPNAALLPAGDYTAAASVRNAGTGFSYDIDAHLAVTSVIQDFPLNTDPGWTRDAGWSFGVPTGIAGDPTSGHTGSNVFGFNLNGNYGNNLPERRLTTGVVNCSGYSTVALRYWRWLGVESAPADNARVQASHDGVNFTDVWVNPGAITDDHQWVEQWIDLTAIAAEQSTVYVRWIMGPTNASITWYGWNIDDISFRGVPSGQTIRSFNMDTDPGFTKVGNWNWGTSSGTAGDPLFGHTGVNMYGFNLLGAYPDNLPERPATSPAINCSGFANVHLKFWRVLSIEDSAYDHAKVQVSNDGVNFTDIWVHDGPTFADTQWTLQDFDISAIADNQPTIYLRWIMGTSDTSVNFGGWSLDDISVTGTAIDPNGVVWVNFGNVGTQTGTQAQPFASLTAGATVSEAGGIIRFQGNSIDTTSSETMVLSKPLRLEGTGGPVRIGQN